MAQPCKHGTTWPCGEDDFDGIKAESSSSVGTMPSLGKNLLMLDFNIRQFLQQGVHAFSADVFGMVFNKASKFITLEACGNGMECCYIKHD